MKKIVYIKKTKKLLTPLLLLLIAMAANIHCQDKEKIKTLIITGGHDFERASFFKMFDEFTDIEYHEIIQPEANQAYTSPMIDSVDVLIFYDMVQEISEAQKAAFLTLLKNGKSMLFLHHCLASYQDWDEFSKIIGGKYYLKNEDNEDPEQPQSNYKHDVDLQISVVNKNHPVTQDIPDFQIHDEIYGKYLVLPGVYPLLTTNNPESGEIIAWINHYRNASIIYIQSGHDHVAYENANYRKLIGQAIRWLAEPGPY
jgi:hypothetical protein